MLTSADTTPMAFEELQSMCEQSCFKFDFSLFEELDKSMWGLEVITDEDVRGYLKEAATQKESVPLAIIKYYAEHKRTPEND